MTGSREVVPLEKLAKHLLSALLDDVCKGPSTDDEAAALIVKHLRRVELQAFERAAELAERCDMNSGYQIAKDIRSLSSPTTAGEE